MSQEMIRGWMGVKGVKIKREWLQRRRVRVLMDGEGGKDEGNRKKREIIREKRNKIFINYPVSINLT